MNFRNACLIPVLLLLATSLLTIAVAYDGGSPVPYAAEVEAKGFWKIASEQLVWSEANLRRFLRSSPSQEQLTLSLASAPASSKRRHHHHRHAPRHRGRGVAAPGPSPHHRHAHAPATAPSPLLSPGRLPITGPAASPMPPPAIIPLPAPSTDCHQRCADPFTLTPPGAPCGCVIPMEISLQLGVPPYAFFPLVSELAEELASGTFLSQSQVRILGANNVENNMDKTEVKAELVPLGEVFDNTTAVLTAQRFWNHEVGINETLFGSYTVLYVHYPGLPPSPPEPGGNAGIPTSSRGPYEQPLSVDIKRKDSKLGGGTIAVVTLSAALLAMICLIAVWFACRCKLTKPLMMVEPMLAPSSMTKKSGGASMLSSSLASSTSISFASSFAPYTGSAKTFSLAEIERATDSFKSQNIIGEGGFGRVYQGLLDDSTSVAVKVLTRDDHQGGREFAAEVEMLSRLHHRNLVKLIGICIEDHMRCLVYELIPNGSVESHLHGIDKDTSPLDWEARLKIALGAARGLAYLHEDSNPRVIHRDFKASNILLEEDFTPKVSDFGLAKAASDEMGSHISTRVMGTFGYVAPEYAMTGHLLVKSDVYSYGVVLLELLSGRKPVDMSQPPGQENLVTWARPLLNSREGLEILVDPTLNNVPFDNLARVAAIASMCVQPEVSHRPFMGEVVQALKLVYNDSDASDGLVSGNGSMGGETPFGQQDKSDSAQTMETRSRNARESDSFISIDYDSGMFGGEAGRQPVGGASVLSDSESFFMRQLSGSFRRQSASAPATATRSTRSRPQWYRVRHPQNGTVSESGMLKYKQSGANRDYHSDIWP